ncbi:MAG: MMPL family transporter, partial [Candidatus Cloacimonetes bacterium]|nr:MMPL family transporter [Candidatus Cloacimonadota bacterium]
DFTITAIIAVLKDNALDEYIISEIENLIKETPGEEETVIGGLPFIRGSVSRNIQTDMGRLMPIGLLIMLIFLFVCFKQLRGVLLPFFVVIMFIIFSFGIIPLLGWKIQVITVILPVILLAIANDYGIHMIAKYQEENIPGNKLTKKELAKKIFNSLGKPVLITGLTTIAGMLCLLGHAIVPAKQLGILAASGIAFALFASLFFIPAIISLLPKSKPVFFFENTNRKSFLEYLLLFFGDQVSKHPKRAITGVIIFAALSSIGIFSIVVDTDPKNYFLHNHPVVYATNLVNRNLGGSQNLSLVYKGEVKDSRMMHKINSMEQTLQELPEVGNTTSVARVIRQMSRALNDPDEVGYDRIPDAENAVAQYFELYAMSGDAEDFEKLVDFPYEHAVITARINTTSTAKLSKVVNKINNMTKNDPDILLIGGFGLVLSDLAKLIINGQFLTFCLAVIIVALLIMISFRSIIAGLISAIPLILSMAILFGLMGLFGIELNMVTALLSSIMIGVGIDYTIHFLWRYREERQNGL